MSKYIFDNVTGSLTPYEDIKTGYAVIGDIVRVLSDEYAGRTFIVKGVSEDGDTLHLVDLAEINSVDKPKNNVYVSERKVYPYSLKPNEKLYLMIRSRLNCAHLKKNKDYIARGIQTNIIRFRVNVLDAFIDYGEGKNTLTIFVSEFVPVAATVGLGLRTDEEAKKKSDSDPNAILFPVPLIRDFEPV